MSSSSLWGKKFRVSHFTIQAPSDSANSAVLFGSSPKKAPALRIVIQVPSPYPAWMTSRRCCFFALVNLIELDQVTKLARPGSPRAYLFRCSIRRVIHHDNVIEILFNVGEKLIKDVSFISDSKQADCFHVRRIFFNVIILSSLSFLQPSFCPEKFLRT